VQAFDPAEGRAAVVALDRSQSKTLDSLLVLAASGELALLELEKREDMISGEIQLESTRHRVPLELPPGERLPERVLLNEAANGALVLWSDGRLQRYDLGDPEHTRLVQSCDVVEGAATLTCATFLIGKSTVVVGDSSGALSAWFVVKPPGSSGEGGVLVRAHELATHGPALRALAVSARGRVLAAADDAGSVRLWNVTNDRLLLQLPGTAAAVLALALAPKEDGLLALRGAGAQLWDLELRHPEASLAALFAPVWYEGAEQPQQVWQSSSGTDSFEPKLGLWPLIFGTLKATVYSMIFAVPIALLAALYTSQFLSARMRAPVKATVEMMASLPSVVLGFLAGIVVAPYVDRVVPALLLSFACVPFALLCGAQLARLLPEGWRGACTARGVWR
jgi:phosphate transport system permease protein